MSVAGRFQKVLELLGGQPQTDEDGNILIGPDGKVLLTPAFITPEEGRKLLDLPLNVVGDPVDTEYDDDGNIITKGYPPVGEKE